MMDIDFIKWMCEKAEGFSIEERTEGPLLLQGEAIRTEHDYFKLGQEPPLWRTIYYPLLLQRAIEGVNRKCSYQIDDGWYGYYIEIGCNQISIHYPDEPYKLYDHLDTQKEIDQAKESALKYIYEQEKE